MWLQPKKAGVAGLVQLCMGVSLYYYLAQRNDLSKLKIEYAIKMQRFMDWHFVVEAILNWIFCSELDLT